MKPVLYKLISGLSPKSNSLVRTGPEAERGHRMRLLKLAVLTGNTLSNYSRELPSVNELKIVMSEFLALDRQLKSLSITPENDTTGLYAGLCELKTSFTQQFEATWRTMLAEPAKFIAGFQMLALLITYTDFEQIPGTVASIRGLSNVILGSSFARHNRGSDSWPIGTLLLGLYLWISNSHVAAETIVAHFGEAQWEELDSIDASIPSIVQIVHLSICESIKQGTEEDSSGWRRCHRQVDAISRFIQSCPDADKRQSSIEFLTRLNGMIQEKLCFIGTAQEAAQWMTQNGISDENLGNLSTGFGQYLLGQAQASLAKLTLLHLDGGVNPHDLKEIFRMLATRRYVDTERLTLSEAQTKASQMLMDNYTSPNREVIRRSESLILAWMDDPMALAEFVQPYLMELSFDQLFSPESAYFSTSDARFSAEVTGDFAQYIIAVLVPSGVDTRPWMMYLKESQGVFIEGVVARKGMPELLAQLIASRDVSQLKDSDGRGLLHHALWGGDLPTVQLVWGRLSKGQQVIVLLAEPHHPLSYAGTSGNPEVVAWVLDQARSTDQLTPSWLNQQDSDCYTPFLRASAVGNPGLLAILAAADQLNCTREVVVITTLNGQNALHLCADAGVPLTVVTALLEAGVEINGPVTDSEWTPLFIAMIKGNGPMVEGLLNASADTQIMDPTCLCAADYCRDLATAKICAQHPAFLEQVPRQYLPFSAHTLRERLTESVLTLQGLSMADWEWAMGAFCIIDRPLIALNLIVAATKQHPDSAVFFMRLLRLGFEGIGTPSFDLRNETLSSDYSIMIYQTFKALENLPGSTAEFWLSALAFFDRQNPKFALFWPKVVKFALTSSKLERQVYTQLINEANQALENKFMNSVLAAALQCRSLLPQDRDKILQDTWLGWNQRISGVRYDDISLAFAPPESAQDPSGLNVSRRVPFSAFEYGLIIRGAFQSEVYTKPEKHCILARGIMDGPGIHLFRKMFTEKKFRLDVDDWQAVYALIAPAMDTYCDIRQLIVAIISNETILDFEARYSLMQFVHAQFSTEVNGSDPILYMPGFFRALTAENVLRLLEFVILHVIDPERLYGLLDWAIFHTSFELSSMLQILRKSKAKISDENFSRLLKTACQQFPVLAVRPVYVHEFGNPINDAV